MVFLLRRSLRNNLSRSSCSIISSFWYFFLRRSLRNNLSSSSYSVISSFWYFGRMSLYRDLTCPSGFQETFSYSVETFLELYFKCIYLFIKLIHILYLKLFKTLLMNPIQLCFFLLNKLDTVSNFKNFYNRHC